MDIVTLQKNNLLNAFNEAGKSEKKFLMNLFPDFLAPKKDWKSLTTWEQIAEEAGEHPVNDLPYPNPKNDKQEGVNAFHQLTTIREVLNAGKDADWNNSNEEKWYPWLNVNADSSKPSGFGLSLYAVDCTFTFTYVGSRLSFNEEAKAKHAFKHFQSIYEKFMLITKTK